MTTDLGDMGREAGRRAREKTQRLLERGVGPSLTKTLRILDSLVEAKTVRAQWDREAGWQYSEPIDDNRTRRDAVALALTLYDVLPSQRHEVSGAEGGPIRIDTAEIRELLGEEAWQTLQDQIRSALRRKAGLPG